MYYLNTFFIYSIFGFVLETIYAFAMKYDFSSGILYGPWTPIYGIGVIIIILLSNYLFMNLHMPRLYETIIAFFVITFVLTIIEWLGGIGIEKIFNITFWDYSHHKYHIGKYISLKMSIIWGIGSVFLIYLVRPWMDNLIKKIPLWLTIPVGIIFIIDVIFTFINKMK